MEFDWDEDKRAANLEKHGVDFAAAAQLDWDTARTRSHERGGETRFRSFIYLSSRLHVIIWVPRNGKVRVISLRKANIREVHTHG